MPTRTDLPPDLARPGARHGLLQPLRRNGRGIAVALPARADVAPEPAWKGPIDKAVPGIERLDMTATRRYRSTERLPDAPRPGCYALVMVTLDTPGQDKQRAWVDGVFDAADSTTPPPDSGLIATHFDLSVDG